MPRCTRAINLPLAPASLNLYAISLDSKGNVFIAEPDLPHPPNPGRQRFNYELRHEREHLTVRQSVHWFTAVGNGVLGFAGDGGQAVKAEINQASGVAVDSSGNFYLADAFNNRIRKIDTSGVITTVAGSGVYSYPRWRSGYIRQLFAPHAAADVNGNLFIADTDNNVVREAHRKA